MASSAPPTGILPMLPIPSQAISTSRRVQQHQRRAAADYQLANSVLTSINNLHSGVYSSLVPPLAYPLQPSTIACLTSRVLDSCTRYRRELACGVVQQDGATSLDPLHFTSSQPSDYSFLDSTPALHLKAARVSLPAAAGTAEPALDTGNPALFVRRGYGDAEGRQFGRSYTIRLSMSARHSTSSVGFGLRVVAILQGCSWVPLSG